MSYYSMRTAWREHEKNRKKIGVDFCAALEEYLVINPSKEDLAKLMGVSEEVIESWLSCTLAPPPNTRGWIECLASLLPESSWH